MPDPKHAATAARRRPLLSGRGAPQRRLGSTGDHYVDLTGWLLFGPKTDGGWPAGVPLQIGPVRTTADDLPLATTGGMTLRTDSGAALAGDGR